MIRIRKNYCRLDINARWKFTNGYLGKTEIQLSVMRGKEFAARIGFVGTTAFRLLLCPGDDILYVTVVVLGTGSTTASEQVDKQAVIPDSRIRIRKFSELEDPQDQKQ